MSVSKEELVYENDENLVIATASGVNRRTTTTSKPIIPNGPESKGGKRTGWYITFDEQGESDPIYIESAGELANLPSNALLAQEYLNLLRAENPTLAAELESMLTVPQRHTAHHTQGADVGSRVKEIFRAGKLSHLSYQDSQIGDGIRVSPVTHRAQNPTKVTGKDGIKW
ncbi:MAG: hypothetical protein WCG44_03955 [bacterium]